MGLCEMSTEIFILHFLFQVIIHLKHDTVSKPAGKTAEIYLT